MTDERLLKEAGRFAETLRRLNQRVVFAESCTAGLIAATLGRVPGISEFLCGSAVVYRNETKHHWLHIPRSVLKRPGPVSAAVARLMAANALKKTPEASIAASVTGHFGPGVPAKDDGKVFVAISVRGMKNRITTVVQELKIRPQHERTATSILQRTKLRFERQVLTSQAVLFMLRSLLELTENQGSK